MNQIWIFLIVLCLIPRGIGLSLNTQANDNHISVIRMWMADGEYPAVDDCWECFQPPLYYALIRGVAEVVGVEERADLRSVAHVWNFVFCIVILAQLRQLITRLPLPDYWRYLLFVFFALNPALVAINIQATNDTLIIMIGLCTMNTLAGVVEQFSWTGAGLLWVLLLCAGVSKGNGLVLVAMGGLIAATTFLLTDAVDVGTKIILIAAFAFSLPATVALAGGYYDRYESTGDPFRINQRKSPPPPLTGIDVRFGKRPGIRSVTDGYLTFRLADLLRHPQLGMVRPDYAEHRTSFWTLLYGQAFHAQFAQHPTSWRSVNSVNLMVARGLYVLGLIPLTMLLIGAAVSVRDTWSPLMRAEFVTAIQRSLPVVFLLCYVGFQLKYSYDYRDFSTIKLIFLFPAYAAFVHVFAAAVAILQQHVVGKAVFGVLAVMCLGYLNNIGILLGTLWNYRY